LVEAAINEKLTPDELLHWQELQKGTRQAAIAEQLGIKQAAVSKRSGSSESRSPPSPSRRLAGRTASGWWIGVCGLGRVAGGIKEPRSSDK
jgi:hypothetical protein